MLGLDIQADGAGLPSQHNGLEKVVGFGHPCSLMVLDYHLSIMG